MRYFRTIISLLIILWLGTAWAASDIQQGVHGMKWGSSISENGELTKVHQANQAAYYANSNMVYQSANQPVPGVFYGF